MAPGLALIAFFLLRAATILWADPSPIDYWTTVNPSVNANSIHCIAYGNGRYVAVGDWGAVLISEDGQHWRNRALPATTPFGWVTFGNGIFVAYAADPSPQASGYSTSYFMTSVDGENWSVTYTQQNPSIYGRTSYISRLIWANGMFIAVGGNDQGSPPEYVTWMASSPDGTNWSNQIFHQGLSLYSITYGNNQFVAVGQAGLCLTSPDGLNWATIVNSTFPGQWWDITFWNGRFVVLANTGYLTDDSSVFISSDGTNWGGIPAEMVANRLLRSIGSYGSGLVATGEKGATFVSSDATNWTQLTLPIADGYFAGAANGRSFVAGAQGAILGSSGGYGQPWDVFPGGIGGEAYPARFASDGRVLVATGTSGLIARSTNGIDWTEVDIPGQPYLDSVIHGKGRFVAVGSDNLVVVSPDGLSWQTVYSNPNYDHRMEGVAFDGNQFLAVGWRGYTLTSEDGLNWQSHNPTNTYLYTVTAGAGLFVATTGASIVTSLDGVSWLTRTNLAGQWIQDGTYGAGRFVLASGAGAAWVSTNGIDWSTNTILAGWLLNRVIFAGDQFVAAGSGGLVFTSPDGVTWTEHFVPAPNEIRALGYAYDRVFAGDRGCVITASDPLHGPLQTIRSVERRPGNRLRLDMLAAPGMAFGLQTGAAPFKWGPESMLPAPLGRVAYDVDAFGPAGFFRAVPR
jgi:hypothetical protein